jgi:cytochrome c
MTQASLLVCAGVSLALCTTPAFAGPDPASLFSKKCSGCHTFGHGDRVGPDLKGVTERRTRDWLLSWIRSSQRMVEAGDPTAAALFERFKRERMPDQNLPPDDIRALVDYLAANGPLTAAGGRPRHADTASAGDIALGRGLFAGSQAPRSGGAPCGSCHIVRQENTSIGATFAGDLTHVYSRFQDAALSEFLRRPCFPRAFGTSGDAPLTENEVFAVKAFLRYVDHEASRADRKGGGLQ